MSYVIDVYRGASRPQTNLVNVALYISLFPQLIAGPIVRYHDIDQQIMGRSHSIPLFATGIKRFIFGLGKKVIIANPLGHVADQIFAIPPDSVTTPLIWLAVLAYSLQIYFDFSGYSDMAIGLGRMFGFRFLENFNYPYISRSVQEFWRRWHISLSRWFRDYLYIPLGGNRCSRPRMYFNLVTVFFLCGLWHGASWNFVIWGLLHGTFLILERVGLAEIMGRLPAIVRHTYVLLFIAITWVFFRSESLSASITYLAAMAGYAHGDGLEYYAALYLNGEVSVILVIGIIFSTPVLPRLRSIYSKATEIRSASGDNLYFGAMTKTVPVAYYLFLTALLVICAAYVASGTYNPFIYFRF